LTILTSLSGQRLPMWQEASSPGGGSPLSGHHFSARQTLSQSGSQRFLRAETRAVSNTRPAHIESNGFSGSTDRHSVQQITLEALRDCAQTIDPRAFFARFPSLFRIVGKYLQEPPYGKGPVLTRRIILFHRCI
jgi:hypothetical protein